MTRDTLTAPGMRQRLLPNGLLHLIEAAFAQVPVADLRTSRYDGGERMKLIGLCK